MATKRWAIALAVLLCLLVGLGLAEATGTTQLAATVIRIFTPSGTLVVETDDPAVKVTIEGDGGLVITGAGPHEVRLKPGSYKLQADKNGQPVPLERELVSVAKGGREVVRVKLETPPASAVPKSDQGAFVLLAAGKERKFASLAEAVLKSKPNDTIEVRGNGPFVTKPIVIPAGGLTIRAGQGFRPVVSLTADALQDRTPLLYAAGPLVLEGLELQRMARETPVGSWPLLLLSNGSLRIANCRFLSTNTAYSLWVNSPVLELRNCEFLHWGGYGPGGKVALVCGELRSGQRVIVDNCVVTEAFAIHHKLVEEREAVVQLTRNTFCGPNWLVELVLDEARALSDASPDAKLLRIEAIGNVFVGNMLFRLTQNQNPPPILRSPAAENFLANQLVWKGERNVYAIDEALLNVFVKKDGYQKTEKATTTLSSWREFWGAAEPDSLEGRVRFQGGEVIEKLVAVPEQITAEDFRLREGSPGYRAGKDGKDLGADVDLVGPGAAYERWKKTPEYEQWLNDTGQLRAEAPKAEPKAFVVLGGKGVAERRFDTLAEAVERASDGDTIEIRGNGPFVTESIEIYRSLTIRASAGFRPVLRLGQGASEGVPLLRALAPLTVEGLELVRLGGPLESKGSDTLIFCKDCPLSLLNCRLVRTGRGSMVFGYRSPRLELRNCEFSGEAWYCVGWDPPPGGKLTIDHCAFACSGAGLNVGNRLLGTSAQVRCTRNTFVIPHTVALGILNRPEELQAGVVVNHPKGLLLEFIDNVIHSERALVDLRQFPPQSDEPLTGQEGEAFLKLAVHWSGTRNLYSPVADLLRIAKNTSASPLDDVPRAKKLTTLADWKEFWGSDEEDCILEQPRFRGGNILAMLRKNPQALTPEDLRLVANSPAYRAGEGGKDLGADVDLVGPGPAYERWKKSPEYLEWLKETGQLRAEAPKAEIGAFVVLGGKGVAERKFDTLAEAVQRASGGDTIEIRGNGPFVSDGVRIGNHLVIRAGEGYAPSITLSKAAADKNIPLLTTSASLVLEGLELRRIGGALGQVENRWPELIESWHGEELHVANCRLGHLISTKAAALTLRNCELSGDASCGWRYATGGRCTIENCVSPVGGIWIQQDEPDVLDVSIRVRGNTFVGDCIRWELFTKLNLSEKMATPPIQLDFSRNVARCGETSHKWGVLVFHQLELKEPYSAAEAEALLLRMVGLAEKQNVYQSATHLLRLGVDWNLLKETRGQDLADWNQFWALKDTGSVAGDVRFQGGDLNVRALTAPEKLTAEDFRLRPDSPGYRAGSDGKDLGAEVDLVGPGPAYERWKKTPEYQQWLKETGQMK